MLLLGLEIPIFLVMLFHDYAISRFLDQKALKIKQKDYEDYFLKRYGSGETIARKTYVPLSFDPQHTQNLLTLCTKYSRSKWLPQYHVNKRKVRNYEPKIEVQYLGFRWQSANPEPVRTEMIRCTDDYALIAAENGWTGFLLKREPNPDETRRWKIPPENTLFQLYTKFKYGKGATKKGLSTEGNNKGLIGGKKLRS